MGMKICPHCGELISDRADVCPNCKVKLSHENTVICQDCQTEYRAELSVCPHCGCPNLPDEREKRNKKGKIKKLIIFAVILVAVFIICKRGKESIYLDNMAEVTYTMLDGGVKAEDAGNLILGVWYNAIYKIHDDETDPYTIVNGKFVDDFNDALKNLNADEDFIAQMTSISNNQDQVLALMKELRNPPKKFEEGYQALKEYYEDYWNFTESVIWYNGSYNSFSEEFGTYDDAAAHSYDKVKMYLQLYSN